ncbi:hypothetical protein [Anthocerotibacter panamensis]|uniref:hypothetical protein n=1 Tax=Anthocerotibacter panamensis TaxID=2857077 RepID=UPI001C402AF5|nr:hypothetical protein [Anthocerotibacter panamensis]
MGSQVQFFMTYEDEIVFFETVSSSLDAYFIYNAFTDPSHMVIESLLPIGSTLYDSNLSICFSLESPYLNYQFFNFYSVDLSTSEAIQFNRCEKVNPWLSNGRLWYEKNLDEAEKSSKFLLSAKWIFKWLKKNYQKNSNGVYIGPEAFNQWQKGNLQLGPTL